MIKKRETCLYCGEKMESVTAKKKFCSDKCKVYWNRAKVGAKQFEKEMKEKHGLELKMPPKEHEKWQKFESALNKTNTDTPKKNTEVPAAKTIPKGMTLDERIKWMEENP